MTDRPADEVRSLVRGQYASVATRDASPCCAPGCCGPAPDASLAIGYSPEDLAAVPEGSNLGLGCGNPHAIANLKPGETVLDLGAGAGFDCFLAARAVGPRGRVIGVDMTPEMLSKARENARKVKAANVDFRLGEIEHLPVADATVDVILSNCVINLSPEKSAVFAEALRVLKPGGRLRVSDVVKLREMPDALRDNVAALTGCVAGAAMVSDLEAMLRDAGFVDVRVTVKEDSRKAIAEWFPGTGAETYVASADIEATRPAGASV